MNVNENEQRWFALIPEQIRSINQALAEGDFGWGLPWDDGRNRWAAFTDDELTTLRRCLRQGSWRGVLAQQVADEVERRRA